MEPEQEGETTGVLSKLLIVLASAVLLILILWKVFDISNEVLAVEACRDSIHMAVGSTLQGKRALDTIKCPIKETVINTGDDDELKGVLADELAECWYKYGQGRLDLFKEFSKEEQTYCAVCSSLQFEDAAKGSVVTNLPGYLSENRVPEKYLKGSSGSI